MRQAVVVEDFRPAAIGLHGLKVPVHLVRQRTRIEQQRAGGM